jgi:hypothetical protein
VGWSGFVGLESETALALLRFTRFLAPALLDKLRMSREGYGAAFGCPDQLLLSPATSGFAAVESSAPESDIGR